MAAGAVAGAAANVAPAYPRAGTTKILDNDRVQVWNIAWLKGQPSPLHRHIYDLVGVYLRAGRPDDHLTRRREASRLDEGLGYFVSAQGRDAHRRGHERRAAPLDFRRDENAGAIGTATASTDAPAFSGAGATQKLDNDRVTVWSTSGRSRRRDTRTSMTRSSSSSTRRARARRGSLRDGARRRRRRPRVARVSVRNQVNDWRIPDDSQHSKACSASPTQQKVPSQTRSHSRCCGALSRGLEPDT